MAAYDIHQTRLSSVNLGFKSCRFETYWLTPSTNSRMLSYDDNSLELNQGILVCLIRLQRFSNSLRKMLSEAICSGVLQPSVISLDFSWYLSCNREVHVSFDPPDMKKNGRNIWIIGNACMYCTIFRKKFIPPNSKEWITPRRAV